jgi:Tfp pilus assembly protein PilE
MKYLILTLALILSGCTSDSEQELSETKSSLRDVKDDLYACQSKLEMYRTNDNSGNSNNYQNTEEVSNEPAEPQYETVKAFHVETKMGKTVCYERNDRSDSGEDDIACGMTFSDCKDGYIYRCMVDVKYKIVEEKRLVE